MAEVLHDFGLITTTEGNTYHVRACGSLLDDSRWQGWLEFEPLGGGETLRSGRETTQPNRADTIYWATGLTTVFIEGSLNRALNPLVRTVAAPPPRPAFDGPAPPAEVRVGPTTSVLNPFSVYRKGEGLLRDQLHALSSWHLVNIILDHELSHMAVDDLNALPAPDLIELIVTSVRTAVLEAAVGAKRGDV